MKIKTHTFILTITLIGLFHLFFFAENISAATSYTNAKEFYNSTTSDMYSYHAEMINGSIYYATSAKLAVSSTNTRYHTLGFDIELSANSHRVSFTVQRTNGSMTEVHSCKDSTHEYNLYVIDDETLYRLAYAANSEEAKYVLDASIINVEMNAILTLLENNAVQGGIKENDHGGFTQWGKVYRLLHNDDLNTLKDIFTGHKFKSYYNINQELPNYSLSISYNLLGLNSVTPDTVSVGSGYDLMDGLLALNNTTYIQKERILQEFTLLNPNNLKLNRKGYHIKTGLEWITKDQHIFSHSTTHIAKDIDPLVGLSDRTVTMYANWQANQYSVTYHSNGGTGSVVPTDFYYDEKKTLRQNTFIRPGYKLKKNAEWNTKKDGTGTSYSSSEIVSNLTDKNGETLVLYANWEPEVYTITLYKSNGTDGTDVFYEQYAVGYFSDKNCTNPIRSISIPNLKGHSFHGYFHNILGKYTHIINENGNFLVDNTYFSDNTTIYAYFTANKYTITFNKQGGRSDIGTDNATVIYNEYFPQAQSSIKEGYTFKGYYTQEHGNGLQHYNEHMASSGIYPYTNNITLFAHWIDETCPDITLDTNYKSWTNHPITLVAKASDKGVGLKSLILYQIDENGNLLEVSSNTNCNGVSATSLSFQNPTEGVARYKAIATDMNNLISEAYQTVYYDITPPRGEIINKSLNANSLFFELNVTDVKVR